MNTHCCEKMTHQVNNKCDVHPRPEDCPDVLISFVEKFREYGIFVHDGGTSSVSIAFCPWCGNELPDSLRDRWFHELELLGFDSPFEQAIPHQYITDAWYRT